MVKVAQVDVVAMAHASSIPMRFIQLKQYVVYSWILLDKKICKKFGTDWFRWGESSGGCVKNPDTYWLAELARRDKPPFPASDIRCNPMLGGFIQNNLGLTKENPSWH
jgi:hypothetical protein